jgi:hypothetical protein
VRRARLDCDYAKRAGGTDLTNLRPHGLITTPADRRPFWHSVTPRALTAAGGRKDERAAQRAMNQCRARMTDDRARARYY